MELLSWVLLITLGLFHLQKDNTKVKILQDPTLIQATLKADNVGFTITLPTVKTLDDGSFSYLEYKFPANNEGKAKIGQLFRASVLHLTAHTLAPFTKEKIAPKETESIDEAFAKMLVNDTYINAYIQEKYPAKVFRPCLCKCDSIPKNKAVR